MIHCDFPMSICSHSFSIQFPHCTSPKYGASPIMIPTRASKVTMIGTMNFKYRPYGKLTSSSDPISVAPGYKEDTKFTPATNALIKMICPPTLLERLQLLHHSLHGLVPERHLTDRHLLVGYLSPLPYEGSIRSALFLHSLVGTMNLV